MKTLRWIDVLPVMSALVLIAGMLLLATHTLTSIYQDIGRHLRLGQIIWETGHVPGTNLFSYTAGDFPFVNHHWLGEVALYGGYRLVGLSGLIMLKAILLAGAFGLALAAAWRPRLAIPAMGVGLVSLFIMIERTDVRPEVFSFLFLAWYLFVLYRKPASRLLWTLPLVQLLWVNTHIYFFMGPFLYVAFLAGRYAQNIQMPSRRLLAGGFLIAAATLVNPHGLAGAVYPLSMWGNYGYSIVENQSPFFLYDFGYPQVTSMALYLGILCGAVSFIINHRNIRRNIFSLVIFVATAVLALMMIRNFPLFALVLMPIFLTNLDEAKIYIRKPEIIWGGLVVLVLLGVSIVTNQIYDQAGLSRRFGMEVPSGPQEPVDFFRTAGLKGPIFNNFDVGSFLIWKLPEEPVFIDGRPEAYPAGFIQDVYIKMQEDPVAWQKYSEHYRLNTIFWNYQDITPWSQAFLKRILKDSQWVPIYEGQGVLILVKNTPENASIISQYRLK
jgi:hypothetical protein